MDWKAARMYAAAMSWPVILVLAWLGMHFGGAAGAIVGTFLGIAVYFYGIWKAIPKDDPPKNDKGSGSNGKDRKDDPES